MSVIVPVLNEAPLADDLAARLRGHDAVVVDGGSSDGTRALLERAGLKVIDSPRGRPQQMNAGARAANGDVFLFLHADTRLPEGATDAAERAVGEGAVGGCFGLRIESPDPRLRIAAHIITWRSRLLPSASGDQAIFVSRRAFERLGGYRELPLCEDLDLVARLRRIGRFVCLDGYASTSARRWEKNGVARTIFLMWALRLSWHLGVPPEALGRLYRQDVR